jgi:hypothetical protein
MSQETKDRRVPIEELCFIGPTKLPGITMMLTTLVAGRAMLVDGKSWAPPPMWLDPDTREVKIADFTYPIERVHYYRRAKMAITRKPEPIDVEKYTVGKRVVVTPGVKRDS